jgi:phage gp45-like
VRRIWPRRLQRIWSIAVKRPRKFSPRRLQYENLEARQMMAVTAGLSGGVLTVNSNDAADAINFKQVGNTISINGVIGSWGAAKVKSINVNLNGGDDSVSLNSWANGGNAFLFENVTVRSGLGNEVVHLANGKNVNFSGVGNVLTVASNGSAYMNGVAVNFGDTIQPSFSNGVLTLTATNWSENLKFVQANGWIGVLGVNGWWNASSVNSIVVHLQEGSDAVYLDSLANGGNQALQKTIKVNSGTGSKTVYLTGGDEASFNGVGHQLIVGSDGSATLDGTPLNVSETIQASFAAGVLTITATNGDDDIKFLQGNGWIGMQGGNAWWQASAINSIVVNLQAGNDEVSLDSLANGGNEAFSKAFTINSGAGNETVHLANVGDVSFSGAGHQLTVSASGKVMLDGVVLFDPTPPPPATNWFDTHITDAALRDLGHNLYLDNLIDRNDMIALLNNVKDGSLVDAAELNDLRSIVAATSLFGSQTHVQKLASYIANGTVANTKYQGAALGNLGAGSSDVQLDKLVNKWFFGLDRPTAGGTYRQFVGQLFVNGAAYTDVHQGTVGDCYFVASLAEAALRSNGTITNMFVVNGDGTYTVKFYGYSGVDYVTVDSYLPTNGAGVAIYASYGLMYNNAGGELWVALAEKAYAQLNEFGWSRPAPYSGQNSYDALSGGYIASALTHISGQLASLGNFTSYGTSFNTFVNAYNAGELIGFATFSTPANGSVVGDHAYSVVSYNASNQTITLFNPWGIEYGLITMSWAQIQQNFQYFDCTV